MLKEQIIDFKGKNVLVVLNNNKTVSGNLIELLDSQIKLQTDLGVLSITFQVIDMINQIDQLKKLFVYVCKNELLGCKGIRLISSKQKINWPCKYFKKYQCSVKKVCNFNDIPLKIKNDFIDGLHSIIPVIGQLSQKNS